MKHIISVGGGLSSTIFLPIEVLKTVPKQDVVLVMARLPNEDPDVWRLVEAVENRLDMGVQMLGNNEHPFHAFDRSGYLGNSRVDPCSDQLKRQVIRSWVRENYGKGEAIMHVGIGAYETDRQMSIRKNWKKSGYEVQFPLIRYKHLTREYMMAECRRMFGFIPRLYLMGFTHNNCGGACIKGGFKEWARLLYFLPDVFAWWEEEERKWRAVHGDYTILKSRVGGVVTPMTLEQFRTQTVAKWGRHPPKFPALWLWNKLIHKIEDYDETPACTFCDALA